LRHAAELLQNAVSAYLSCLGLAQTDKTSPQDLAALAALAAGAETRPALLSMGAAFLGALYLIFFMNLQSAGRGLAYGEPAELRGVVREVRMSGDTDVIEVSLLPPQGGRLRVISGRDSGLDYGDELYLAGIPEPPSSRLADPVMFFPRFEVTARDRGNPIQASLLAIRAGFLDRLHLALRPDSAALAGGLTLGAKDGFSTELKEKMRASGTTHLVALSGYNVSILALAVSSALGAWFRRRTTFLLTARHLSFRGDDRSGSILGAGGAHGDPCAFGEPDRTPIRH